MAVDIATIHDRRELAKAIAGRSDDEINASLAGRSARVIDQLAEGMKTHFAPDKAAKQNAVIQYDVRTPDGVMTFQMRVADGQCHIEHGAPMQARVKLDVALPDFLRLASGKLSALHAIMTGRLNISGDILLARRIQGWFQS